MPTAADSSRLMRTLQRLFSAQARTLASQVSLDGPEPDMSGWTTAAVAATRNIILEAFQQGMLRSLASRGEGGVAELARLPQQPVRPSEQGRDGMRTYHPGNEAIFAPGEMKLSLAGDRADRSCGATGDPSPGLTASPLNHSGRLSLRLSLRTKAARKIFHEAAGIEPYDPRIIDAVDQLVLTFCRETNQTAALSLREAKTKLRELLRRGLKRGTAAAVLAREIRRIFADPQRAHRIAFTEVPRAVNAGRLTAATESKMVRRKRWLASGGACEKCMSLDGKEVRLNKPFVTLPGGGPYAEIMYPPYHPYCMCDWTEVL